MHVAITRRDRRTYAGKDDANLIKVKRKLARHVVARRGDDDRRPISTGAPTEEWLMRGDESFVHLIQSIYEDVLEKHLKKCNAREKSKPAYYVRDINCGENDDLPSKEQVALSSLSAEEMSALISKVQGVFQGAEAVLELRVLSHPALQQELTDPSNGKSALKHLQQQASIVGHLSSLGLLGADRCYVEFGAGRGKLSHWVRRALPGATRGVSFLLVERCSTRFKVDGKHQEGDVDFRRLLIDIQHLHLGNKASLFRCHSFRIRGRLWWPSESICVERQQTWPCAASWRPFRGTAPGPQRQDSPPVGRRPPARPPARPARAPRWASPSRCAATTAAAGRPTSGRSIFALRAWAQRSLTSSRGCPAGPPVAGGDRRTKCRTTEMKTPQEKRGRADKEEWSGMQRRRWRPLIMLHLVRQKIKSATAGAVQSGSSWAGCASACWTRAECATCASGASRPGCSAMWRPAPPWRTCSSLLALPPPPEATGPYRLESSADAWRQGRQENVPW
uniref:tRNA:m(4)X modification enzyme TRM13 n=2 Tax=Petromyzon marinus TaxID=7757 RepID=A0AAJ7TQL2_PETMA|nr:tRNA:m(4)X modification enzyme TRM13 homolog isoform X2 [Petromyzon marinus]